MTATPNNSTQQRIRITRELHEIDSDGTDVVVHRVGEILPVERTSHSRQLGTMYVIRDGDELRGISALDAELIVVGSVELLSGSWYITTRSGLPQGPYASREDAESAAFVERHAADRIAQHEHEVDELNADEIVERERIMPLPRIGDHVRYDDGMSIDDGIVQYVCDNGIAVAWLSGPTMFHLDEVVLDYITVTQSANYDESVSDLVDAVLAQLDDLDDEQSLHVLNAAQYVVEMRSE